MRAPASIDSPVKSTAGASRSGTTPFFQPKLRVNTPGDACEREADTVAERITAPDSSGLSPFSVRHTVPAASFQRKCADCAEEEALSVQRQTATTTTTTPAAPTSDDMRDYVLDSTRFLEISAGSLGAMQLDQAAFDRILDGWFRNQQAVATALADPALSGDPTLQTNYRAAYNAALRTLLTRMATVLSRSAMQLFVENLHRLPDWIEFSFQNVPLTNDAQRRTAVQGLIDAMNNTAVFAGFSRIERGTLENILQRLKTLGEEARELIRNQLANDLVFANQLKTAYRTAITNLLARAATDIGSSVFDLYWQYRYGPPNLILEWADQQIGGISTPLPQGVAADPLSGNVEFRVGNVLIRVLPDGARAQNGAETTINMRGISHNFHARGGVVDSVTPPNPVAEIQTKYGPNVTAASVSGYGRGTTAADTGEGNTALGFHEGRHALVFLTYFRNNAFPNFGGQVGQAQAAYQAAWNTYANAVQGYAQTMNRSSEVEVDCVGVTIEQYYQALGQASPVRCP